MYNLAVKYMIQKYESRKISRMIYQGMRVNTNLQPYETYQLLENIPLEDQLINLLIGQYYFGCKAKMDEELRNALKNVGAI